MSLTPEEKDLIKRGEEMIGYVLNAVKEVQQFKLGDYLIAFYPLSPWIANQKRTPVTNSYGAPKKFQVIAVDVHGVPYMKELNKAGKPAGAIIPSIRYSDLFSNVKGANLTYIFEIDPDYTDAIILSDEENYDASNILKEKSDMFKEISKHNKAIKLNTDYRHIASLVTTFKVGDLYWKSNMSSWYIVSIDPIPKDKAGKYIRYQTFLKVSTNKGKELLLSLDDLSGKALYSSRPRTYRELKDPK